MKNSDDQKRAQETNTDAPHAKGFFQRNKHNVTTFLLLLILPMGSLILTLGLIDVLLKWMGFKGFANPVTALKRSLKMREERDK